MELIRNTAAEMISKIDVHLTSIAKKRGVDLVVVAEATAKNVSAVAETPILPPTPPTSQKNYDLDYMQSIDGVVFRNNAAYVNGEAEIIATIGTNRVVTIHDNEIPTLIRDNIELFAAQMPVIPTPSPPKTKLEPTQPPPKAIHQNQSEKQRQHKPLPPSKVKSLSILERLEANKKIVAQNLAQKSAQTLDTERN